MAMIELDPAYPVLWRDARSVQIGARPAFCVLDDPPAWQLELLESLAAGIPAGRIAGVAAALGAEPRAASDFVARLAPILREVEVPHEISLVTSDRVPHEAVLGVFGALRDAGFAPVRATSRAAVGAARTAVLVSTEVVPPHLARELMGADIPHVPLALEPRRALVGPFVLPGETACLACLWAHESDRDPAWPTIATQLVARPHPDPPSRSLATLATALIPRVIASVDGSSGRSRSVTVASDGRRRWRSHRPHAACLCRSPRESETPVASIVRSPPTTTATGTSRRE